MSANLLTIGIFGLLILSCASGAWRLLRHWVHPRRILTTALSAASMLLLLSLAMGLGGVYGMIWWAALLAAIAGVAVSSWRAMFRAEPAVPPAESDQRPSRRHRRVRALATPPSMVELGLEIVFLVVLLVLALWAG